MLAAAPFLAAAAAGTFVVSNMHTFAFSDYEAEALPAVNRLVDGDVGGFLSRLPGYAGAVILDAPAALIGNAVGGDHETWAWRFQALPGLLLLGIIGMVLGHVLARALGGVRGAVWGSLVAVLLVCSPFAVRAQSVGHPEELLVAGLALAGVLAATRGRFLLAGSLVGTAAVAKPWALLAVPVVLVAVQDRRDLARALGGAVVCGLALMAPTLIAEGGSKVTAGTHASTGGIFKPSNLFWFFGEHNPRWSSDIRTVTSQERDAAAAAWAQRLEPGWAAQMSHPLIIAVGVVLAGLFGGRRSGLERRGPDLLLLLAACLWWRCLLDTWNTDYYALGGLVALAAWEAVRRRPPVLAVLVTALAWLTFEEAGSWADTTPDIHTAIYLAWAVPVGVGLAWRAVAPSSAVAFGRRFTAPLAVRLPGLAALVAGPADEARPSGRAVGGVHPPSGVRRPSDGGLATRGTDRPSSGTAAEPGPGTKAPEAVPAAH